MHNKGMVSRNIGFLVYDGMQALDLVGPLDVFDAANRLYHGPQPYRLILIGLAGGGTLRLENGLAIVPDCLPEDAPVLDTLIIPGGEGSRRINRKRELLDWIRMRCEGTRRIVSVCTGLYVLAATGLLDGRRATTHWRFSEDIRACYPAVRLEIDQIYVSDGRFHTSGGLTAGMDLALSLIEADLGPDAALAVAREMVMYMKRPGNQRQFSGPMEAQTRAQGRFGELIEWLFDHLDETLSVERMAERMVMSPRNFRRVFRERFGVTPARYLEYLRLEQACVLLTSGAMPIEHVAARVGFASADAFRRRFRERYRTTPGEYRARFGSDQ